MSKQSDADRLQGVIYPKLIEGHVHDLSNPDLELYLRVMINNVPGRGNPAETAQVILAELSRRSTRDSTRLVVFLSFLTLFMSAMQVYYGRYSAKIAHDVQPSKPDGTVKYAEPFLYGPKDQGPLTTQEYDSSKPKPQEK